MRGVALLILVLLVGPTAAASLQEARRLTEAGAYTAAIATFDALMRAAPGNVDLMIEAARVNGWADRNVEAARLYEEAVRIAPARLADVRAALAWQLLWAGQAERALRFFDDELAARPADPDIRRGRAEALVALQRLPEALAAYREQLARFPHDRRAAKGEARVLMWLERPAEARTAYAGVLAAAADDREARLMLARLDNQQGYHQTAVRQLRRLVGESGDTQARAELVRALYWSGDSAAALAATAALDHGETQVLRGQLARELKQYVRLGAEASHDSDELDVLAFTGDVLFRPRARRELDLSLRHARLEQRAARINGRSLLLGYGGVFGEAGAAGGLLFPKIYLGAREYDGWSTPAWAARLKWLPADLWRLDFEAGNQVVENIQSIQNEVQFDYLSGGFDYRFAPRWLASLGLTVGRFDDGNRRTRVNGRVEYALGRSPRLTLGLEGMGFRDSDPPSPYRGYWSPDRYHELKLAATVQSRRAGWDLQFKAALGRLWETPGDSNNLYALEASALRDVDDWGFVRLYAGYSDSAALNQGSGGGYSRGYFGAALGILF